MTVLGVLAAVFIGLGTAFMVTSGVAVLRLRDVYSRINAVTKAATLGVILILVGSFLLIPSWDTAWKLVLAVILQLLTSPVGSLAIGRAAYRSGALLTERTNFDDLGERVERK
jgi:multicomponent Na+:H+ antiporter subunit G